MEGRVRHQPQEIIVQKEKISPPRLVAEAIRAGGDMLEKQVN